MPTLLALLAVLFLLAEKPLYVDAGACFVIMTLLIGNEVCDILKEIRDNTKDP